MPIVIGSAMDQNTSSLIIMPVTTSMIPSTEKPKNIICSFLGSFVVQDTEINSD